MLKFEDYPYERPNLQTEKASFQKLLTTFTTASTLEAATKAIEEINVFRNKLSTLFNLVYIRSSIDTNDEFYQKERDYFDEVSPQIQELNTEFYKELVKSPYREDLEARFGTQLFQIADFAIKSFSPAVMELMQKENKLTSEYSKLKASAQIEFQGETYTLAQLEPFEESKDREVREQAIKAKFGFFEKNAAKFDDIYDQLVKIRHEIATTLRL